MSKEVENKINISRELIKKQVFDSVILLIAFGAIYFFCLNYLECYDKKEVLMFVLISSFLVLSALSYYSYNAIRKPMNNIVALASNRTAEGIDAIQQKAKSQKENIIISGNKIKNTQELVDNLKEYSDAMNQLTTAIQEKTSNSLDFTNSEYDSVKTNIEKMFSIRHKIQTIAELILELSDFVQSISSTIGLVEDIAEQTNLLALNAAVEAARAGEHGKGFAVVASEIRKLADESKQATAKIISLINDIQQTANSTVLATEEGTKEIESGLELAHLISGNIEQLIKSIGEILSDIKEIAASSSRLNSDTVSTQDNIKEILTLVDTNKQITDENERIYEKIESASNSLKQSLL